MGSPSSLIVSLVLALAACGGPDSGATTTILVSAASSLTDGFVEIESAFEASTPGVDVILNLAGSSTLREQILEGAPVDVYAAADISNMNQVADAGEARGRFRIFAKNVLQIAVPRGNPAGVVGLEDFGIEERLIGLCAEDVPCGVLAREALAKAGVAPAIDTNEPDVRSLLGKIEAGELDAGITYVTDVVSTRGSVTGIEIPQGMNVVAEYPIAVLAGAPRPEAASDFVEFVLSDEGQRILSEYGFESP